MKRLQPPTRNVPLSGICRFRYAEPRQSVAIKDCSREPVGFFTVPDKVTTKKATPLGWRRGEP